MKTHYIFLTSNIISKFLCILILILFIASCKKDNNPKIEFEFEAIDVVYYPDKNISITFDILLKGDNGLYTINWFNPNSLKGKGPFTVNISDNLLLDFEISDNKNIAQRFQYEILTDTIDSLRCDYRNNYIGTYTCDVTYTYDGTTKYYKDTLKVVKNNSFYMLNILTKNDIKNNYEGKIMTYEGKIITYLNSNGSNSYPTGDFFGYHSRVSFSNDSIHYSASGPLGFYYTNIYEGTRINY